jgi:hypothetical protein
LVRGLFVLFRAICADFVQIARGGLTGTGLRHSARQRMASRQPAGTDTSTAAFQRRRTQATFEFPAVAGRDGQPRCRPLREPGKDALTAGNRTRFVQ